MLVGIIPTACVDDNDDEGMPRLEVIPSTLHFSADGQPEGKARFTVRSNRTWELDIIDGSDWVTPSATRGSGDGAVEFTIPASNRGRMASLRFTLSNDFGVYLAREVSIEQGDAPQAGEVSALVAYIKATWPSLESGTEPLNYTKRSIPAVILANNESGNNFGKLYVGDNITMPNSAIILYSTSEYTQAASAAYPVGRRVMLDLSQAQYAPYGNLRELKEVGVTLTDDPAVALEVPTLTAVALNTGDYQGQYVRVSDLTPQASYVGEWWAESSKRVVRFDAPDGGVVQSYMATSSDAPGFANLVITAATGTLSGTAEQNFNNIQLIPTRPADVAPFAEEREPEENPYISQSAFVPTASSTTERHYPSHSTINGEAATGFKLGTSSLTGTFTSAALGTTGDRTLSFYAVAWTGRTATLYIRVNSGGEVVGSASGSILGSSGAAGAGNDYTFTDITEENHYTFSLQGLTASSTVTISTSPDFTAAADTSTGRAIVLGVRIN